MEQEVPGIEGIDTRQLTKIIREKGSMLGKIVIGDADPESVATVDPASLNLVKEVSIKASLNVCGFSVLSDFDRLSLI